MDHEQAIELKRFSLPHEFSSAEDGHVVSDQHSSASRERRHWSHARNENEFVWRETHDLCVCDIEVGPYFCTEGSINGGKGELLERVHHGAR